MRYRSVGLTAIMLATVTAACATPAPEGDRAPVAPAPTRVTLISGGGSVTTLSIPADSQLDSWDITASRSLDAVDAANWDGQPIEDYAHDAKRGIVFLVLPDRARESADEPKRYRIVAAQLPRLERIATYAFADSAPASILFDPVGDRLIAQAVDSESIAGDERPGWRVRTVVLSSPALSETRRITQHVRNVIDGTAGTPFIRSRMGERIISASRAATDGVWIVSERDEFAVGADSLISRTVDTEMSPADSAIIAAVPGAVAGRFGFIVRDAGARHRLLQVVIWPDSVERPTTLIALRDVAGGTRTHPLVEVPTGVITMLDDERHVFVQEVDGSLRRPASVARFTGRVFVYDAESGARVLTATDARLAGSGHSEIGAICSTPDNSRIYLRIDGGSLGVLRTQTAELVVPNRTTIGYPTDLCIFAP